MPLCVDAGVPDGDAGYARDDQQHVLVRWPHCTLIRVHEAVPLGRLLGGNEQKRRPKQAAEVGEEHEGHLGRVDDRVDRQQPPLHYSLAHGRDHIDQHAHQPDERELEVVDHVEYDAG